MEDKLQKTRRKFVITTTLLTTLSVLLVGAVLYETNLIKFDDDIASEDLQAAVSDYPEVAAYLETEHQNEAHFLAIANIIKNEQQSDLGDAMLIAIIPTVLAASVLGYMAARILLRPVKETYEAQERFIGDAAHELRNPLATMSVIIENARRSKAKPTKQQDKTLQQIQRQLGRMVRINEDLLYLERDIEPASQEPTNLSELLHDIIEDLQYAATARKLKFKLDIAENVEATIQAKDFVRVAKNLIENAIKYSKPTSKSVEISLQQQKGRVLLEVTDNGIGIPQADMDKIGERFFRAGNVGDLTGSGLGISIVQKVVDHYGGKLDVESTEGKGTTFRISL